MYNDNLPDGEVFCAFFHKMGAINEIHSRKPLPPEVWERIREQRAQAERVRSQRQASPESVARKQAEALFSHIKTMGVAMSNPDNVLQRILAEHALRRQSLPFVGFWGVGEKSEVDLLDLEYLDRLEVKRRWVEAGYSHGASFTFILADLHGVFNGYVDQGDLQSGYLNEVQELLERQGFQTRKLSELYSFYSLTIPDSSGSIDTWSEAHLVYGAHREQYEKAAQRHHRNGGSEEANGGYWYVAMRLSERGMLMSEFPDAILLVNGSKMTAEPLMPPRMPVFYLPEGPVWFKKGQGKV